MIGIVGTTFCLLGAAACFAMFFGFGPSPENQMVFFWGVVCLLSAAVCWSSSPICIPRLSPPKRKPNDWARAYPVNPFPLAFACVMLFIGLFAIMAAMRAA